MKTKPFYGWWVTVAAICTFGIAVGIPYYNMPFFYDYYEKAAAQGGFGWSRDQITLGFPLAALFTLWVGPLLVHRFSPRKLILAGTGATAAAFIGFSRMSGAIELYYFFWFVYTVGYIFSGPIPHQVIISQWFRKKRGRAMGITYVGVGRVRVARLVHREAADRVARIPRRAGGDGRADVPGLAAGAVHDEGSARG